MSDQSSQALTVDHFHQQLSAFLQEQDQLCQARCVVALSGGVDSTVLLALCNRLLQQGMIQQLRAIHIHHGLSAYADHWAQHVTTLCQRWQIPLSVHHVHCNSQQSVEESARTARYHVFEQELQDGEWLLQGHHRDDQIETLLYRLIRGTGIDGMRGIPHSRPLGQGRLIRPLLTTTRQEIEAWAAAHNLSWIEDDSNGDTRFDRNFLRHQIVPSLKQRWPGSGDNIIRFAEHCDETAALLQELATDDYRRLSAKQVLPGQEGVETLCCQGLLELSRARQNLLLRYWLDHHGISIPSQAMLRRIMDEVVAASDDAVPLLTWGKMAVRRYRQQLFVGGILPKAEAPQMTRDSEQNVQLMTMVGNGFVRAETTLSWRASTPSAPLAVRTIDGQWSLRGDLTVAPFALPGRKGQKTLKKWLNELGVAPWLRERLPVLHRGDQLIAIPDVLVADGWQAEHGKEAWTLEWQSDRYKPTHKP